MIHELKTWPPYFKALCNGSKTFEVRKDDRPFAVDDVLVLLEWDPKTTDYTGHRSIRRVSYILRGSDPFGFPGFVVMGLAIPDVTVIP